MNELFAVILGAGIFAVLFVIPVLLLIRTTRIGRGMEDLQRRLVRLEHLLTAARDTPPADAPAAKAPVCAAQQTPAPQTPAPQTPAAEEPEPPPVPSSRPAEHPLPPGEPTAFERAMANAWNWFIIGEEYRKPGESWEYAAATNWLLRVGIAVVLAGIAFFLKYSIEKGLMGPLGRVALSLAAGLALIVGGVRLLFKKYHLLGQGLIGAGFVTLYFAFYAASGLYQLLPSGAAFALMVCVTASAGALAVLYRSVLIALLGVLGGYATPLMVGDAGGSAVFFYAYVLLLSAGVLGMSLVRRWPMLNILGMLASYGLAFLYCGRHHAAAVLLKDLIFLSGIHLLYLLSVIANHLRKRLPTGVFEWTALFLNAVLYWLWTLMLFKPVFGKEGVGLISLAVCAVYVALTYANLRGDWTDRVATCLFAGLASVFLAMSPVLMLKGEWLTFSWCLQALAMLWIARRTDQTFLGQAAAVLFTLACARGIGFDLSQLYGSPHPWTLKGAAFWKAAGLRALTYGVLPATLTAAWRMMRTNRHAAKILALVLVQVWLYLTLESNTIARVYAPAFRAGAVTLGWTLFAFALLFTGIRVRGKWLRWCGLALFGLAVLKLLVSDLDGLGTPARIVAFISVGILLVLGSFVYLKYRRLFEPEDAERSTP